jgi:hypothetical protein
MLTYEVIYYINVLTISDKGWVYCITSQENKKDNVFKVGMTTRVDLEEHVRTPLH